MFFNRCYDKQQADMHGTYEMNGMNHMNGCYNNVCTCEPVMECPQERICHREMCYEVPHVCPFM